MNRDLALWIGILIGPIVWLISFQANYALVPWGCIFQNKLAMYAVSIAAFVVVAAAGIMAWRQWSNLGKEADPVGGDTLSRSRIMAFSGVILCATFCIIIVAQAVPEFVLEACQ